MMKIIFQKEGKAMLPWFLFMKFEIHYTDSEATSYTKFVTPTPYFCYLLWKDNMFTFTLKKTNIQKYCSVIKLCTDEDKKRMIRNRVSDCTYLPVSNKLFSSANSHRFILLIIKYPGVNREKYGTIEQFYSNCKNMVF